MEALHCHHCQLDLMPFYELRFVPIQPRLFKYLNDPANPKFNVMVYAGCTSCRKFIKFVPQTHELMDYLQTRIRVE